MICEKCATLRTLFGNEDLGIDSEPQVTHYHTYAELKGSAEKGCLLCKLFQRVLLEPINKLTRNPERRQFQLDSQGSSIKIVNRHTGGKHSENHGYSPWKSGTSSICCLRESHEWTFNPAIHMYLVSATELPTERSISGRLIPPQPELELAKEWLRDCDTQHRECQSPANQSKTFIQLAWEYWLSRPQPDQSEIGFRVLDIGLSNDADIYLTEFNGQSYYATLSHCWGTSQPIKLEEKRMDEFQEGIAFWKLPKTFQDAVRVTRSLGLRYLWIDSLCIIQDSDKDWKHQCAIMDDIYSNSYVTLAGTDAKDCDSGFLQDRKPLVEAELPLTYNGKSYTIVFRYWGPRNRCDSTPYRGMPLLRRAWVLQERLLSRRVLYFDPKTMFMECFVNVRREDCSHPMSLYNATTLTRKSRRYDLGRDPKWYWQNLTTTYSSLVLSRVSDKLPALSGIATRFAQVTGFQYLAGIWRQDLPSALAWRVKSSYGIHRKTINEFPSIHPEDSASSYIAPSWSWAAAGETGVEYSLFNPLSIWYEKLKILDCYVSPVDCSAPFGVVNGGWLHVSGKTCQVSVKHTKVSRTRPSGLEILSSTGNECGSFMPDTFAKYDSAVLLYLGRGSRAIYIAHCALAIEPVVDYVDRYRRVGFVQDEKRSGNPNLYDCFQNQKPRRLYLV